MLENPLLEKVFISLVVGMIGLVPVLLQRLSNKRREKSYTNQLNKLQIELEFLEKWKNFSLTIDDEETNKLKQTLGSSISAILEKYKALNDAENKFFQEDGIVSMKQISIFRRFFLLFWPKSFTGWILHTLFYFIIIFATSLVLSDLISPIVDPNTGESDFIFSLVLALFVFGIPAFIIQRFAIVKMKRDLKVNS